MTPKSAKTIDSELPRDSDRRRPPIGPTAVSVDMHIHSDYSDAPMNTVEVILSACRRMNIGVAIADHNEIRGSIKAAEQSDVLVFPAIEVGSRERLEFLAYFIDLDSLENFYRNSVEPFKKSRYFTVLDRSFTHLIPEAKESGALVCLPHPYAPSYKNINFGRERKEALFKPEFFSKIDLIEVLNGHLPDNRNFKAFILSEIFEKNVSAGSDAHRPEDIGSAFLRFNRPIDRRGVFDLMHFPIKVGMSQRYSITHFASVSRSVMGRHLQLFFSKKRQRHWMMKYENGAASPSLGL
jgi:predicted metal-dependent phosphoesterase TrpH